MEINVPELDGYKFSRAQHLSYEREPLVQLVYLGPEGVPLVLCFIPVRAGLDNEQDKGMDVVLQEHHGLNTAEWIHGDRRYIIVSDVSFEKLDELKQSALRQLSI